MKRFFRSFAAVVAGLSLCGSALAGECAMAPDGSHQHSKDCPKSCCAKKGKQACPMHPNGDCDCKHDHGHGQGPRQNFGPKKRF